jgi:EAL domain-containing protein (putative c-di-GMP-specific phosphodiesterase class I)
VRWQHPDRGLLGPDQFIALAERTGLIQQLGRWVLDAAMRQCRAWVDQGLDVSVAINLTAKDVQPTLLGEVTGTLARYGLSADHLSVEITETMLMGDVRDTEAVLSRLREWGVRVAIDDFGTGYSSLAYLKRLPVDEVKIDRSFIYDLSVDASDTAIVESVISLGHAFGLKVTAEGVEDLASLVQLAKLGCDEVQGNYLSSPMDPGLLFAWATGGTLPRALIA